MMDEVILPPEPTPRRTEGESMDVIGLDGNRLSARVRVMIEEHAERFLTRLLPEEIRGASRGRPRLRVSVPRGRKEAVFKALRMGSERKAMWAQVEIEYKEDTPRVKLRGVVRERMHAAGVGTILLTTGFSRHYATATAIALRAAVG